MEPEVQIDIQKLTGFSTLVGKLGGIRDFPKFVEAASTAPEEGTVIFDWSAVEIATASYFGATVLSLLKMSAAGGMDRYFLNIGLNQNCLDELKLATEYLNLVLLIADSNEKHSLTNFRVLGKLEPVYSQTLAAIGASGSGSASSLYKGRTGKAAKIGKTGWANRLSHLFRLRLVKRHRVGRELVFQPIYGGD